MIDEQAQIREDFRQVIQEIPEDVHQFINHDVLITGASGFVASWLIGVWIEAKLRCGGKGRLKLTCRRPSEVLNRFPELAGKTQVLIEQSDIRTLSLNDGFDSTYVIHAATSASASLNEGDPFEMIDVIVEGTRNLMQVLSKSNVRRIVNLSSGAVYGKNCPTHEGFHESSMNGPDISDPLNAYHEAKRLAELIVSIGARKLGFSHVSLRLFTFLAPYLPLDTHFAAGNFLRQALRGEDIIVKSGGGSVRSYQYGSDLAKFVICSLTRTLHHPVYNVGSSTPITIGELANKIQKTINPLGKVIIQGTDDLQNFSVYVPDTSRIEAQFGISNSVSLERAIIKTAKWSM